MHSDAATVSGYLSQLPEDRRAAIAVVRDVIRENLPAGIEETMNWGMIAYEVPLAVVPDTYNGKPLMFAALASQKRHMAVYLSGIYADPALRTWFEDSYRKSGRRMDVGKSCVRFRRLDDLPLELIGAAVAAQTMQEFVDRYHASRRA